MSSKWTTTCGSDRAVRSGVILYCLLQRCFHYGRKLYPAAFRMRLRLVYISLPRKQSAETARAVYTATLFLLSTVSYCHKSSPMSLLSLSLHRVRNRPNIISSVSFLSFARACTCPHTSSLQFFCCLWLFKSCNDFRFFAFHFLFYTQR